MTKYYKTIPGFWKLIFFLTFTTTLYGQTESDTLIYTLEDMKWQTIQKDAFHFKVDLFGRLDFDKHVQMSESAPSIQYVWSGDIGYGNQNSDVQKLDHPNFVYALSITSYPSNNLDTIKDKNRIEEIILSSIADFTQISPGILISLVEEPKFGMPGYHLHYIDYNRDNIHIKSYFANELLYTLICVSKEHRNNSLEMKRFFKSFDFVNCEEGSIYIGDKNYKPSYELGFPLKGVEQRVYVESTDLLGKATYYERSFTNEDYQYSCTEVDLNRKNLSEYQMKDILSRFTSSMAFNLPQLIKSSIFGKVENYPTLTSHIMVPQALAWGVMVKLIITENKLYVLKFSAKSRNNGNLPHSAKMARYFFNTFKLKKE